MRCLTLQKARIAFRYGYFGDTFRGSQVQPDVETVQGSFMHVFQKKLKWTNERMPMALSSRTDAGVHVRLNGGSIDLDEERWNAMGPDGFLRAVGHQIPTSISLFDVKRVDSDWSARISTGRTYRYRMECMEGWIEPDLKAFTELCSLFEGQHDWSNFCRREPNRTTIRTVEFCRPWINSERILGFEINATGFVWNQVRRIASAMLLVITNNIDKDRIVEARDNPNVEIDLGLSEPDWLILWNVSWDVFDDFISEEPEISAPDRTSKRWQELARLQQKEILIRQFDIIQGRY